MNYQLLKVCIIIWKCIWVQTRASTYPNNDDVNTYNSSSYAPSPYNLEHHCDEEDKSVFFTIAEWNAAIFKIGYLHDDKSLLAKRRIHRCKINIKTETDFFLVVSIEQMKIRGTQDNSNKWICPDYLKFWAPGQHIFKKIFSILSSDIFSDKQSEKLCGTKQLDGKVLKHTKILDGQSTDMNSFFTPSNKLAMEFHQEKDSRESFNNSFIVVITTLRHASDTVECEGKHKCYGRDVFCINPSFVCDGHVNCAFPGSGNDERRCKGDEEPSGFNVTSTVIIVLVSLVTVGVIVCFIATIGCRMKRRLFESSRRSRSPTGLFIAEVDPTAPGLERESTLPHYETVILSDIDQNSVKDDQTTEEMPPQYESLFPQGPPTSGSTNNEEIKDS